MNYNEKIKETYLKLITEYRLVLDSIIVMMHSPFNKSDSQGMTIPMSELEHNVLNNHYNQLKTHINDFNYYTRFYPDRENVWKDEIEDVRQIESRLSKLDLDNNIKSNK